MLILGNGFLGKLNDEALKHDWIEYMAGVSIVVGLIFILALITFTKSWKWLWKDWITSVDHKKIGIMYLVVSSVMLFKGLVDAAMMRAQQAFAFGDSMGYLAAPHFQQIFTAHGVTMILFVGMGVMNWTHQPGDAPANRRPRCVLSFIEQHQFLAFYFWRIVHPRLFGHRYVCRNRLVFLPSPFRTQIQSGSRCGSMDMEYAAFGSRKFAFRDQFLRDDHEDALSRNVSDENAYLCLGHFILYDPRTFRLPHPDWNTRHAQHRPSY